MIFHKNPSEVWPEVVQPGPLLVQPQIKTWPGWTRSSQGWTRSGPIWTQTLLSLVQPEPEEVQPQIKSRAWADDSNDASHLKIHFNPSLMSIYVFERLCVSWTKFLSLRISFLNLYKLNKHNICKPTQISRIIQIASNAVSPN